MKQTIYQQGKAVVPPVRKIFFYASCVVFIVLSVIIYSHLNRTFHDIMIKEGDSSNSDIIPQLMTLNRRFLNGEFPYRLIPFDGYNLYPTYLPLQWAPYALAEKFKFDYRWIGAAFLWLSCLFHFFKTRSKSDNNVLTALVPLWPLVIWMVMVLYDSYEFGITVESLIAAYYLFTANTIKMQNRVWLACGISLCLFSRYSIILWVPVCLLFIQLKHGWKPAFKIVLIILSVFFIFYWFPFLSKDHTIFLNAYKYHTGAALGEWQHLDENNNPAHLYNGLGFASYGYRFLPFKDLMTRLAIYQKLHISICLSLLAFLSIYYYKNKGKIQLNDFLLIIFKLYLSFFYAFIQIPYKYLFFTPVIVTSVILAYGINRNKAHPLD